MKKIKVSKLYLVTVGIISDITKDKFLYTLFPYQFYCTRRKPIFKYTYEYKPIFGKLKLYDNPEYNMKENGLFVYSAIQHKTYTDEYGKNTKISLSDLKMAEFLINSYNGGI